MGGYLDMGEDVYYDSADEPFIDPFEQEDLYEYGMTDMIEAEEEEDYDIMLEDEGYENMLEEEEVINEVAMEEQDAYEAAMMEETWSIMEEEEEENMLN